MSEIVIRAGNKSKLDIDEIVANKRLLYYFAWRELKARYKQTLIGVLWVILQPLALVTIFSLFIGRLGRTSDLGVPYFIFVYAGLIFWNFFGSILTRASNTIVSNANVIRKVYFPRILMPLAEVVVSFVDFIMVTIVFFIIIAVTTTTINLEGVLALIPLAGITVVAGLGAGMFFAAINVKYRDIKIALPFIVQAWFFSTPVIYPLSAVPDKLQGILHLNPMTGVVSTSRTVLFDTYADINYWWLSLSVLSAAVMLVVGLSYFVKKQGSFTEKL